MMSMHPVLTLLAVTASATLAAVVMAWSVPTLMSVLTEPPIVIRMLFVPILMANSSARVTQATLRRHDLC